MTKAAAKTFKQSNCQIIQYSEEKKKIVLATNLGINLRKQSNHIVLATNLGRCKLGQESKSLTFQELNSMKSRETHL